MKKFFILAVCLFVFVSVQAQEETNAQGEQKKSAINWSKFNVGAKAGLNFSTITKSEWLDVTEEFNRPKISVHMGLITDYRINRRMGVQLEFLWSRQGGYCKQDAFREWIRMNYFNIPVLYKLYLGQKFSLDVGPQVGFLINGRSKSQTRKPRKNNVFDDMEYTNSVELSMALGVNYNLPYNFFVSARYTYGLTNVFDYNEYHEYNQNQVVQIGLGWKLKK